MRSGFANAFIYVYVFVSCACSGLRVTYHPSDRKWIWCCKFINSLALLFSFNDSLQQSTYPIAAFVGEWKSEQVFVFYWSSPMLHVNSRENVNSKMQWFWKVLKAMLNFTILLFPPCWVHLNMIGDLSSVCGSQLKSAKPHSYCRIRSKRVRAAVTDD